MKEPPRQLVLHEHETIHGIELSGAEVDALLASGADLQVQPMRGTPSHYALRPGSKVGLLRAGMLSIEIRPKIPIARLLYLLSFSIEHGSWPDETVAAGNDDTLTEALIGFFARLVRPALARGVIQGFRSFEESLPGVRGRIRIDDQLRRHFGRAPPVEVRYDDFTEDIDANRLIRSAIHALGRVAQSPISRGRLRQLAQPLQRVSIVEYSPSKIPDVHVDRLNAHYDPALRLAAQILRATSVDVTHGASASTSVLFDMNTVFETFLRRALRAALGLEGRSFPKPGSAPRLWLDDARTISLLPDLSWWHQRRCLFVGDAKYKRLDASGAVNADIYQLLAYLAATDLPQGLLIYAQGGSVGATHCISRSGKTVLVRVLELGGSIEELRGRVQRLAESVSQMVPYQIPRPMADRDYAAANP